VGPGGVDERHLICGDWAIKRGNSEELAPTAWNRPVM
jgi:hypothetical protein